MKLNAMPVFEGQLKSFNPLTEEIEFDFDAKTSEKIIGFAGYLKLANGFDKTVYWGAENMLKHGKKYSQTFKKYNSGLWSDDFEKMGLKTVIKDLLKKFAPLSTEILEAVKFDQAVIKDNEPEYVDNGGDDFSDVTDLPEGEEPKARTVKKEADTTLFDKEGNKVEKI
jgi:recombination protein RecT